MTTKTLYKCCGTACPGLPFKASEHDHPVTCIGAEQPVSNRAERWHGMAPCLPCDMDYSPEAQERNARETLESLRVFGEGRRGSPR